MSVVLNFCRHRRRGRKFDEMPKEMPSPESPPDDIVQLQEIAQLTEGYVGERIANLTTLQSSVVALRFWRGMGYAQIASALGLRTAAVRQILHRARVSIRSRPSAIMEWAARRARDGE